MKCVFGVRGSMSGAKLDRGTIGEVCCWNEEF